MVDIKDDDEDYDDDDDDSDGEDDEISSHESFGGANNASIHQHCHRDRKRLRSLLASQFDLEYDDEPTPPATGKQLSY